MKQYLVGTMIFGQLPGLQKNGPEVISNGPKAVNAGPDVVNCRTGDVKTSESMS